MPERPKQYPEFKNLLRQCWQEATRARREGERKLTLRAAAKKMRMKSPSALHSWLRGERAPEQQNLVRLARFFYPDDSVRQEAFVDQAKKAIETSITTPVVDPFEELTSGRAIRIGVINYGDFCEPGIAGRTRFLNALFDRFAAFAGVSSTDSLNEPGIDLSDARISLCETGQVDVILGILATPDRALHMKFFMLPITIPVNAIYVADGNTNGTTSQLIHNALLRPPTASPRPLAAIISPIVDPYEVGGLYVRHYLRMKDDEFDTAIYDEESYLSKLDLRTREAAGLRGAATPVIVADEFMCIKIIKKAKADPRFKNKTLQLVEHTIQEGGERFPAYRLAFAVNRAHRRWAEFLWESFSIFLQSNAPLVLQQYLDLYASVLGTLRKVFDDDFAQDRAQRWLGAKDGFMISETDPCYTFYRSFIKHL